MFAGLGPVRLLHGYARGAYPALSSPSQIQGHVGGSRCFVYAIMKWQSIPLRVVRFMRLELPSRMVPASAIPRRRSTFLLFSALQVEKI